MPTERFSEGEPARGKITSGLKANRLVERTIEFVETELPRWRDDPNRQAEESEERLNAQLCKFLQVAARRSLKMVFFHHEEKQAATRRVDISALPVKKRMIGAALFTVYDPFLVFEGKRLPAPGGAKREREYVTGGDLKSGGIQRFKLGLHGSRQQTAAMVGYVQNDAPGEWYDRINIWISELVVSRQSDGSKWTPLDQLSGFAGNRNERMWKCISEHDRCEGVSSKIRLHHLWIEM